MQENLAESRRLTELALIILLHLALGVFRPLLAATIATRAAVYAESGHSGAFKFPIFQPPR
jgi:hypothetical protein